MALVTIVRKLLGETRWSLIASVLAFFGLAVLWNWGLSRYQFPTEVPGQDRTADDEADADADADEDEPGREGRDESRSERRRRRGPPGAGIYTAFGVPADRLFGVDRAESPTLLMQSAMANHPLVFLALLGWAISRASASVAGEIERGTLDLTLSRPVRRSTFLLAQIVATVAVFVLLGLAMAAGHLASSLFFRLNGTPRPADYLPMIASMAALGLSVFGYTLPISAADLSRARAGILGLGVTLGGIAGLIFSRQYEDYDWAADLSVFQYYAPVGLTVEATRERLEDLATLLGVFGVGSILAFVAFLRRDLPSNSG